MGELDGAGGEPLDCVDVPERSERWANLLSWTCLQAENVDCEFTLRMPLIWPWR